MNPEQEHIADIDQQISNQPLTNLTFEGRDQMVTFIEKMDVTDGVRCEVYSFVDDGTKDLGVIRIEPGKKLLYKRC